MEIHRFGPDDAAKVAAYVEVANAAGAVDSPWSHPVTLRVADGRLRYGWDGEVEAPFLGLVDDDPVAFGSVATSEYDNLHLAWLDVTVRPECRRQGLGSEMLEALVAEATSRGRTSIGIDGWDHEVTRAFAARHGLEEKSRAINRRQHIAEVDWAALERLHAEALAAATAYESSGRSAAQPMASWQRWPKCPPRSTTHPTDDLDIEDEVYTPERVRATATILR